MNDTQVTDAVDRAEELQHLQAEAEIQRTRLTQDVDALATKISPSHHKEKAEKPFKRMGQTLRSTAHAVSRSFVTTLQRVLRKLRLKR